MSMLAERKFKQKWSLNPRGSVWCEDPNKFGQKMLEKMGWSHGKGLGAKLDGMVDHVKILYKNDSKGMGYKEVNDQWTEHDSNFNAFLQSLSGQTESSNIKISSLEEKSQKSKVRVHYKKFTRGKDLSRCSDKDLANIFGKKSLKHAPPKVEAPEENKESVNDGFTHNAGSMVDYFKKKLPNFGKINGYVVGSNGVLKKDTDSEEETFNGFGFKSPEKKRKSNGEIPNGTPKKMKCDDEDSIGMSNPAFDPLFGRVEVQKHVLNTIQEEDNEEVEKNKKKNKDSFEDSSSNREDQSRDGKKKKKRNREDCILNGDIQNLHQNSFEVKKANKNEENAIDNPNFDNGVRQNGNFEIKREKKKKKENTALDNPNFQNNDCGDSFVNGDYEVKRKKKKKKEDVALHNPNFENGDFQDSYVNDSHEIKRKEKKKKETRALDNPNFVNDDCSGSYVNEDFKFKRKKKKKEHVALDNPNFEDGDCQDSYINENYEIKRKKKKKKEDVALDNPNFNDGDCQDSYVNEEFEVKRKKKKKKTDLAIDNPNFDDSSEGQSGYVDQTFEVERKIKKDESLALDNPSFNDSDIKIQKKKKKKENEEISNSSNVAVPDNTNSSDLNFDLILNVTSTPSVPKSSTLTSSSKKSSVKRRKSVRFSNVTEERIIPNNEDIENRNELFDINSKVIADGLNGASNLGFNNHQLHLEENIDEISKKIDGFQAEIENDINEAKVSKYIGEVGNPDGENEKLPEGTKLKFKYANFRKTPFWLNKSCSKAKSSYKHLIKGDIILGFKNTNLHEIKGYGEEGKSQ